MRAKRELATPKKKPLMETKKELSFAVLPTVLQEALREANTIAQDIYEDIDCTNKKSSPEPIKNQGPILTFFENHIKSKLGVSTDIEDEEINPGEIKLLDEAMALFSQKIKIANCDQIASVVLKRLCEEVEWPLSESGEIFHYDIAKCFCCGDISHCVVQISIFIRDKKGSITGTYSCVVDPWAVMEYTGEEKKSVDTFIVSTDKYHLGPITPWNEFTFKPQLGQQQTLSEAYNQRISEEERTQVEQWVDDYYKENSKDQYKYSSKQKFFATNRLVKEELDNSFTANEEEESNKPVIASSKKR